MKLRKGKHFDLNNTKSFPFPPHFPSLPCTELLVEGAIGKGVGVPTEMVENMGVFWNYFKINISYFKSMNSGDSGSAGGQWVECLEVAGEDPPDQALWTYGQWSI